MENVLFDFLCEIIESVLCDETNCKKRPIHSTYGTDGESCKFLLLRMRSGGTQFQRDHARKELKKRVREYIRQRQRRS